jgi:hypothetical protein
MASTCWTVFSIGRRYSVSAMAYCGLGLAVLCLSPGPAQVHACDDENPCADGETCCNGNCIPESYVCCEDGSSGDGETCTCCAECQSSCSPSTVVCE